MKDNERGPVLVTGGTGYLAGWVIDALLLRGIAVRTTARSRAKGADLVKRLERHGHPDAGSRMDVIEADLLSDDGWAAAMEGTRAVMHTASPMPFDTGADFIASARQGTRRVLEAAARAGVRRVIMTSSGTTAQPKDSKDAAVETIFTPPAGDEVHVYPDSKILAERDAWELAGMLGLDLTAILPSFMQGPPLDDAAHVGTIDVIRRLMQGRIPAIPRIGWNVVDVRDVAELHVLALDSPASTGQRFLGSGEFIWYSDIAKVLRTELPELSSKVPRLAMPDFAVKALARTNPQMAFIRHELGQTHYCDNGKARTLLGWAPRPLVETLADTARAVAA